MLQLLSEIRVIPNLQQWEKFVAKNVNGWLTHSPVLTATAEKYFSLTGEANPPSLDPDLTLPNILKFWDAWKAFFQYDVTGTSSDPPFVNESSNSRAETENDSEYRCGHCGTVSKSVAGLKKHHTRFHGRKKFDQRSYVCQFCGQSSRDKFNLERHIQNCSKRLVQQKGSGQTKSALSLVVTDSPHFEVSIVNRTKSYYLLRLAPRNLAKDYDAWVDRAAEAAEPVVSRALSSIHGVKYQLRAFVNLHQSTDFQDKASCYLVPRSEQLLPADRSLLPNQMSEICDGLREKLANYIARGSGWVFDTVEFFDLSVARFEPIRGSSYIASPKFLAGKHAIVNIQNDDDRCFEWCLLAHLFPTTDNPHRTSNYRDKVGSLKFQGIKFPVELRDVSKIEELNDLSINIFGYDEDDGLHTLRITKRRQFPDAVINLLMLSNAKAVHYTLIRNLDRLMYHTQKHHEKRFFCVFCLHPYPSLESRELHYQYCQDGQRVDLPAPGSKLRFTNFSKMMWKPVVIYADFECFLKPVEKAPNEDVMEISDSPEPLKTTKTHEHVPNSFGALATRCCGCGGGEQYEAIEPMLYRGEDSAEHFLRYAINLGNEVQQMLDSDKECIITPAEYQQFWLSNNCHICTEPIRAKADKAKDHCHLCGKYRGPAHLKCNSLYRKTRDIPVVMHNLRRYDGHLICLAIGKLAREFHLELECIPRGFDDYLSFSILVPFQSRNGQIRTWKLQFIDSYQFLTSSLDSLAENLLGKNKEGYAKFQSVQQLIQDDQLIELLLRKGVYPYEFMSGPENFLVQELPPKEMFYSRLKLSGITQKDYDHAQTVFEHFNCQNLGDYHDIYLKTDVMLLADVFENFRRVCKQNYRLDPVHYITLPSLAWDACLLKTNVELDLLSDPDMYNFLEKAIRGGVSMVSHRYARANNPTLHDYDPDEPISYIIYLDANNLYGWAMSQVMPFADFQWILSDSDRLEIFQKLSEIENDSEFGYIFEIDLQFPETVHDAHNDYPLAPEHLLIDEDMLSPYSRAMKQKLQCVGSKATKLTPHLGDRFRYVIHYRNLKQYMELGMEVTSIHRVLKFRQKAWMKPYIEFNTEMRKKAKTDFEKNFFKLANNAVFGKSMENVRRYRNIKLVVDENKFRRLVASPRYKEHRMFGNVVYAVSLEQESVRLCKPIYTGFTVLDLSKLLMYQFHYGFIKEKFGESAKLLFTDTDSLVYHIHRADVYEIMWQHQELFDFSDYPSNHPMKSDLNKKVMGVFKDELNGKAISEVVALKSKMNSILTAEGIEKKTAKGVSKSVKEQILKHLHYLNTLMNDEKRSDLMRRFQSIDHQLYTVVYSKTSLSAYDDKRFIHTDGITSLAYGHHLIAKECTGPAVEMNY